MDGHALLRLCLLVGIRLSTREMTNPARLSTATPI